MHPDYTAETAVMSSMPITHFPVTVDTAAMTFYWSPMNPEVSSGTWADATYQADTANTFPWDVKEQLATQVFGDLKPQAGFELAVELTCSVSGNLFTTHINKYRSSWNHTCFVFLQQPAHSLVGDSG